MKKEKTFAALAAAWFAFTFLIYLLAFSNIVDVKGRTFLVLSDLFPMGAAAFAIAAISLRLCRHEKGEQVRRFWMLVDLSFAFWFVAETIWFIYEGLLAREVPYPSAADYFWLIGYLPLILAIAGLVVGYKRLGLSFNWRASAWVVPMVLAIIVLVVMYVAYPILSSSEATTAEKVVNPAYAFLDLLILAPALIYALTLGKGSAGRPSILISLALIALAVADITYIWLSWNDLYGSGNFIDIFWVAGYLIFGLAAVRVPWAERSGPATAGGRTAAKKT